MENKKKILVVEDDRDINELISYNLVKEGFAVTSAYDGIAAKETLHLEHFDIVVLDIMLPGLDGFNICKALKDNPKAFNTFVVVISAKCDMQDKLYAHILGADYYLSKPFNIGVLIGIIREMAVLSDKEFLVEKCSMK
ncbi:MAG: response regulator [Candidatus Omnitrophica bacterium]|nr:response regulator [Candidatus Omnitrophota bacterium]